MRWVAFVLGGILMLAGVSGVLLTLKAQPQNDASPWIMVVAAALPLLAGIGILVWAIFQRAGLMVLRITLLALAVSACMAAFVPIRGLHPGLSFKMAVVVFAVLLVLRMSGVLKGRRRLG